MKIFRLSATLTATLISLMPGFHPQVIATEPDYLCFMTTPSGNTLDLSQSLCHSKKAPSAINSDQAFIEEYTRQATRYPDVRDSLIASINSSPEENIRQARNICDALREGVSMEDLAEDSDDNIDKAKRISKTIIANLATQFYCPGAGH